MSSHIKELVLSHQSLAKGKVSILTCIPGVIGKQFDLNIFDIRIKNACIFANPR